MKKDRNIYPRGWSHERVARVAAHYDAQSEDDAIAEAEAAWENAQVALMAVPVGLVARVRAMIDSHGKASAARKPAKRATKKGAKRVA
jgi:hypothetical protein